MVEFAGIAFDANKVKIRDVKGKLIPFYDHLYRIICEEMKATTGLESISTIPDPFGNAKWNRDPINYELFEYLYADRIREAREKIMNAKNNSGWLKNLWQN